jgi:hypothetical protein
MQFLVTHPYFVPAQQQNQKMIVALILLLLIQCPFIYSFLPLKSKTNLLHRESYYINILSLRNLRSQRLRCIQQNDGAMNSPFEAQQVSISETIPIVNEELELTFFNVNKVLDEVRPYLQADGGNVAVVEVNIQTRDIKLLLEGACGSCPSSTVSIS